ncbi:hypothetical protein M8C21_004382 [Ambrosia artemisiifolia]|uniref:Uncharacterized protein n=1 Tax=Ambrosia artemisiifolia TaxID=4212 RepID=A0AAD5C3U8_AMBAR|nr:hypothetical protein M8C21_004382 [Ambrosia artemisiifolia]
MMPRSRLQLLVKKAVKILMKTLLMKHLRLRRLSISNYKSKQALFYQICVWLQREKMLLNVISLQNITVHCAQANG